MLLVVDDELNLKVIDLKCTAVACVSSILHKSDLMKIRKIKLDHLKLDGSSVNLVVASIDLFNTTMVVTLELFRNSEGQPCVENKKVFPVEGPVVDMFKYDERVWLLYEAGLINNCIIYEVKVLSVKNEREVKLSFLEQTVNNDLLVADYVQLLSNHEKRKEFQAILCEKKVISDEDIIKGMSELNFQTNCKELLISDVCDNRIIGIDKFSTSQMESLVFVREKGVSTVKQLNDIESLEAIITSYEWKVRKTIFMLKSSNLVNGHTAVLRSVKANLEKILLPLRKSNPFEFFLALLAFIRVFMTEHVLASRDINYIAKQLSQKSFDEYLQTEIKEKTDISYNNLEFLDILNEILENYIARSPKIIDAGFYQVLSALEEYKRTIEKHPIIPPNFEAKNWLFTNKVCDVIEKLARNRVNSLYFLSSDLTRFVFWLSEHQLSNIISSQKEYTDIKFSYETTEINYKQSILELQRSSLVTYIISSIKDEKYKFDSQKQFSSVSMLKSFILDHLKDKGDQQLNNHQNNYIDLVVSVMFSANTVGTFRESSSSPIVLKLVEKQYSRVLNMIVAISVENKLVKQWMEVIAFASKEDEFSTKLCDFFRTVSIIQTYTEKEYIDFLVFLLKNKFIDSRERYFLISISK